MVINPGNLNVKFKLQTLSTTDDGSGGTDEPVWTNVAEFFGALYNKTGKREMSYTEMVVRDEFMIKTYFMKELPELTEETRLVYDQNKHLYIDYINNIENRNQIIEIHCRREK